jgi:hypothetical protein
MLTRAAAAAVTFGLAMPATSPSIPVAAGRPPSPGLAWQRRALRAGWVLLGLLVVVEGTHDVGLIGGGRAFVEDWLHSVLLIAAAALCLGHGALVPRARPASLAFGAALTAWALGDVSWTILYEDRAEAPFPSVSDAGWLAWYPFTALGVALLIRRSVASFHWHRWMDGLAVMLIAMTPCVALFLQPAIEESPSGTAATALAVAYPILDTLLIGAVLGVYGLLAWHVDRAWLLLGLGCVLMTVGDGLFAVQETRGSTIDATYDFTWSLGALLMALAVWHAPDTPATVPEEAGWRAIVLPLAAQALAIGIQVLGLFHELGTAERVVTIVVLLVAMAQIVISRPRGSPDDDAGR